ncbi:MAG: DUF2461 domain-containing protein [Aristaeellaceae bacterium]
MFTGFPEETLQFFLDIRFHNNNTYFNEHRERFRQDVQEPFYAFIDELAPAMLRIDPGMEVRPYKCLARIRRDTRFSKDKSPYRDHLWLLFRRAAEPREGSVNYWFELSPTSVGWGLGTWGENRPAMDALRRRIAAQPQRVKDIVDDCRLPERGMAVQGSFFKRLEIPDSVPPTLHWLYRAREVYIVRENTQMPWIYDKQLIDRVRADYEAMAPLYRLLRGVWDEIGHANE